MQRLSLAGEVGRRLRNRKPYRVGGLESYGRDGEIEDAFEGTLVHGEEGPGSVISTVIVSCIRHAEPRTDWRERGVIPPKGWYFPEDCAESGGGRLRPRYGGENPIQGQGER